MDTTGGRKDAAMCLGITQQFNSVLGVGCGDDFCTFDGLQRDPHHVTIVPLQWQRVAGNEIVFSDEMHHQLLFNISIAN